jgi:Disulfide bond chaperones of the HSP33 family
MVINSTDIVNEAILLHNTSPVASAALGRTLTMASMMGTELKNDDDRLTVIINGGGEIGKITVCSDKTGDVKGYVTNPECETFTNSKGKLDVAKAVGKDGTLTVIKDMGLKEPFNASVQLVSGEIAEDFATYFLQSEQRATAVALGVLIDTDGRCLNAAGVFVQVLPFCSEENLSKLEKVIGALSGVSGEVQPQGIKDFIENAFGEFNIEYLSELHTEYRCDCSYERVSRIVHNLGRKECDEMLEEFEAIEVCCEFCKRRYSFDRDAVDALLNTDNGGTDGKQIIQLNKKSIWRWQKRHLMQMILMLPLHIMKKP